MKKSCLLLLVLCIHVVAVAQSWQDTVVLIEKLFERYKPANPGCQLAIARNGQVIFSRSWGMADLEHNAPLTNESVIEAGSVSKQFTAAAILLLEQQGKLSLNDDVRKYIPEMPDYGTPITLRHMMQHASGLKDWGSVMGVAGWPRSTKTYTNDDALYVASHQKTLNHKPGDEFLYSNSNYNLFAVIVERVSGKSLAEFTRLNIFEPAGMKHTEWRDNYKRIVPNRAIAYGKFGSTYYTDMPNEYVYGNGGLLTTAEDLLTWNNYYLNGKLGNPSLLSKQLALTPLNSGLMNQYGAGLFIDSSRGWQVIAHNGATAGYRCNLEYFPALGLSIAWISNTSEFDQGPDITGAARNLLVKDIAVPTRRAEPVPVTVPAEKLNKYIGWYRDTRDGAGVRLFIRDGKLANSRGGNMIPVSDNAFMLGMNRIEIYPGKPGKLVFVSPAYTATFMAVDSARLDEKAMREYIGEYYSDETETRFFVRVKDGKLVIHREPKTDYILSPTYKDGFTGSAGIITFERDKQNRVTTLKVSVGRARNIEFKKIAP